MPELRFQFVGGPLDGAAISLPAIPVAISLRLESGALAVYRSPLDITIPFSDDLALNHVVNEPPPPEGEGRLQELDDCKVFTDMHGNVRCIADRASPRRQRVYDHVGIMIDDTDLDSPGRPGD